MNELVWRLVESFAWLLPPHEREAVLGDLLEAGNGPWHGLRQVGGLVARRELTLWCDWRPWLAAFGLAFPSSLFLMGLSVTVSSSYQRILDSALFQTAGFTLNPGPALFLWQALLLAAWAWSGGFVAGSLSRRTLWVTGLMCCVPCLFCLSRFNIESLSRLCLLLFLAPGLVGVWLGLRWTRIRLGAALTVAVTITLLTIPAWKQNSPWLPNWALSWPVWYLVLTARRGPQTS